MRLIEIIGGPGSGKTTTASMLWGHLKNQGKFVEYIREPAQEEIYQRGDMGKVHQLYLVALMYQKLYERQLAGVETVIIDTPLLGPFLYSKDLSDRQNTIYTGIIQEIHAQFEVSTILVQRTQFSHFRTEGRIQATLEEAKLLDNTTFEIYNQYNIPFTLVARGHDTSPENLQKILNI